MFLRQHLVDILSVYKQKMLWISKQVTKIKVIII